MDIFQKKVIQKIKTHFVQENLNLNLDLDENENEDENENLNENLNENQNQNQIDSIEENIKTSQEMILILNNFQQNCQFKIKPSIFQNLKKSLKDIDLIKMEKNQLDIQQLLQENNTLKCSILCLENEVIFHNFLLNNYLILNLKQNSQNNIQIKQENVIENFKATETIQNKIIMETKEQLQFLQKILVENEKNQKLNEQKYLNKLEKFATENHNLKRSNIILQRNLDEDRLISQNLNKQLKISQSKVFPLEIKIRYLMEKIQKLQSIKEKNKILKANLQISSTMSQFYPLIVEQNKDLENENLFKNQKSKN
ncbi:hypothetical protein M0811_14522 [Anaeramoeba ignava]|uniref:Uncharacterized protein n=1 Tax=Anaeramoeba ignava TaxID=1746090 RepID=A0A9Q0LVB3_ANAIG|nr:hypothetical protein M0811_14522 [Anaeramoeba ignava]